MYGGLQRSVHCLAVASTGSLFKALADAKEKHPVTDAREAGGN